MPLAQPSSRLLQRQAPSTLLTSAIPAPTTKKHTLSTRQPSGSRAHGGGSQLLQFCDETRAQYELTLERQERIHEQQLQDAQSKLQDVLRSHIPLAEHERILFAEGEHLHRMREQQDAAHARELAQLEAKWRSEWQTREAELLARCEDEKHLVLDMIPPLELERNDAHRLLKEQEIDQLTWSKALDDESRARECAEARLREACKHIVTLKTCVKRLEQRLGMSDEERARAMELYDKWQQSKLQLAETKGEMGRRVATLKQELSHTQETLASERARLTDLQDEMRALRAHTTELETAVTELRAKGELMSESCATERAQFMKELAALQHSLDARRAKLKDARGQAAASEQRAVEASMRNQLLSERESKWRRQKAALQTRVTQLTSAMRQLQAQQQERAHDAQLSRLLFGDADAEGDG